MKRIFLTALLAWLALPALAGAKNPQLIDISRPPAKLSDLYKFLTLQVRRGLTETVNVWPIRLQGRAAEILGQGNFFEVEMTLKPFEYQGLSFEKGEIFIKQMKVDPQAMQHWDLKLEDYKEVQTRLIFTLGSLQKKLSEAHGELKLRADSAERVVEIKGRGRYCLIPMNYEARATLRWDEKAKKLYFEPKSAAWGGLNIPLWLQFLSSGAVPQEPLLDLSASWIPLNIQEIYVGWDRINLSTNW